MKARYRLMVYLALAALLLGGLTSCKWFNSDDEKIVNITLLQNTGTPGTVIQFTTDAVLPESGDYNLFFGTVAAPLMADGLANTYSSIVPVVDAGTYELMIKRNGADKSETVTFTVEALPDPGVAPGTVIHEAIEATRMSVDVMQEDLMPQLLYTGQMTVAGKQAIDLQLVQITAFFTDMEFLVAGLDEQEKRTVDAILLGSGIADLTKALQTATIHERDRILSNPKDEYQGHIACMSMDGFSAVLTNLSRLYGMGAAAVAVTSGGTMAPVLALGAFTLSSLDALIDGCIPTDLSQLWVAGDQPLQVQEGGITHPMMMGRFTTQSSPSAAALSVGINGMLASLGLDGMSDFILSTLADIGMDTSAVIGVDVQNWQEIDYVEHQVNPMFYSDVETTFLGVLAAACGNYNLSSGMSFLFGLIPNANLGTGDPAIATFNPVINTINGHSMGNTPLAYGGFRFVKQSGWASIFGFEYPSSLTGSQVAACNIQVVEAEPNVIQVNSDPSGAAIFLNGTQTGLQTPNAVSVPYQGLHTIRLTKAGYNDYVETIETEAGGSYTINAQLTETGYPRPVVQISNPEEGETFDDNVITVSGSIQLEDAYGSLFPYNGDGAVINVNGAESELNVSDGYFYHTISITAGENHIYVKCTATNGVSGQSPLLTVYGNFTMPEIEAVLTWNTPTSDLDLHVWNPLGEHCYYSNMSTSDGDLDIDDVEGYGPETYTVQTALEGTYVIKINSYSLDEDAYSDASMRVYADGAESFYGPHRFTTADYNGSDPAAWWEVTTITIQNGKVLYNQPIPAAMRAKIARDMANLVRK